MQVSPQLDYVFGWRWLLPVDHDDSIFCSGFSDTEMAFLRDVLPCASCSTTASNATGILIRELSPKQYAGVASPGLRFIFYVGSGAVAKQWAAWSRDNFSGTVQQYALLPPSNPRVVVPLGNRQLVAGGLMLHRPGRQFARIAIKFFAWLASLGIEAPLKRRVLLIATREPNSLPREFSTLLQKGYGHSSPDAFALYLGLPSIDRKSVILPLGQGQNTIYKQGRSKLARAALHNEAAALHALAPTALRTHIPRFVRLIDANGETILEQEYRVRVAATAVDMQYAARGFLTGLSRLDRLAKPLREVLDELKSHDGDDALFNDTGSQILLRCLCDMAGKADQLLIGHRSHGDFAPWNCSWTEAGFFVYDWESSRIWDVALGDAFYYIVATARHVARKPDPAVVEASALNFVREIVGGGAELGDLTVYWAVWLLGRFKSDPHRLYELLIERLVARWQSRNG